MASWNRKGQVGWTRELVWWKAAGTLYLSVPFTWHLDRARELALRHKGRVVAGGPAVRLVHPDGCDWAETPEAVPYDTLAMHNPLATVTTRGCINRCGFCAVPKIEGEFRELPEWRLAPWVCDNNLLAASWKHFCRVVESLRRFPAVDFNQGLQASLFTRKHADEIAKLHQPMVRFAFDHVQQERSVAVAVETARKAGLRHFGVYVLFGYRDTPDDALYRLETVRSWGIRPNPMRFQPLTAGKRNDYVAPGWTERDLRDVQRYYSKLRWLEHISFGEYQQHGEPGAQTELFHVGLSCDVVGEEDGDV